VIPTPLVAVPFPSGRPDRAKLNRALNFLRSWPIRVHCPLLEQQQRWDSDPTYLCGNDAERAAEIMSLWSDPDQKVVWCGRGGYGATRMLYRLDQALESVTVSPTRFLGYSDITALFAFIQRRQLPIECIHTPVVTEIPDHPQPELLLDALNGKPCPLPVRGATGEFQTTIWGGNLTVLASLCGTPWLPRIANAAILLEDIDEAPYRLDRFVTQLFDSGFFAACPGVFLGQFTKCGTDNAGLLAVKQRLQDLGVTLLGELPVGHEADHRPLFLNRPYRMEASTLVPC
jgi:muramoyltetrapeptide carboxypeptidase